VSKCWKQEKSNWREIALFQPKPAQSGCTGLSGGAPDSVRCARLALANSLLSGIQSAAYGYNSPDCPVCTGLSGEPTSAGPTVGCAIRARHVAEPTVGRGTGLSGVHRTVSGTPTAPRRQRSASPEKERNPHRTVSGVHRTVWCVRRQKGRIAFPECTQRLLAALGL
jgi:hypothetical protein